MTSPDQNQPHSRRRRQLTLTTPIFPEGLISLALLLLIVGCAGLSVQQADWARIVLPVPAVALIAAFFGSMLAKIRVLDSLAHLASMLVGTSLSFGLVAWKADELGGSWRERIEPLSHLMLGWYLGRERIDHDQTYLVSVLVGIIVWLVGYLAAWTLFRRGWILVSLLLPGFLILVNLGYAPEPDTRFLLAYGLLCIPLLARIHLSVREKEWSRHHLVGPRVLPARFLLVGSVVAILASTIGWQSPGSLSQEAFQPIAGEISTRFLSAQDRAAEWLRGQTGARSLIGESAGSYSAFDGAFSVGGPLELADTPQALVRGAAAPYLAAQRYDRYSGRGWSSTSDKTFNNEGPDGRQYSPEMTFQAGQTVPLSSAVTSGRLPSDVTVTPLGPSSDRLLTVDTYLATDMAASVRMSWQQLDDVPFSLRDGPPAELPADLRPLVDLLSSADLRGETGDAGPGATDPAIQDAIERERQQLIPRFLSVRWTADGSGAVDTLFVTGQIPVYDDVDAVFGRTPVRPGTSYTVSGSQSSASRAELADAGVRYPAWIEDRYLSLPSTVTPRTVELTRQLTAASANPLESARLIEQYLRTTVTYDETVSAPPADADLVDHLLFERPRGYCEYYASAMAVMLRTVGIPSRVVVGFFPGQYDEAQRAFLYRQKNAHAWVEVFFPGYGWIPFEPTASRPMLGEGNGEREDIATPGPTTSPQENAVPDLSTPITGPDQSTAGDTSAPQTQVDDDGSASAWVLPLVIGLATVVALAAVGWSLWTLPLRGAPPSSALFLRLRRVGRFFGIHASGTETPREYARAFADVVPASGEHVARIVTAYELDQFGPEPANNRLVSTAASAWLSIRRQLPSWIIRRRFGRK